MRESATPSVVENVVENVVESNATLASYFGVNTRTIQRDLNALQTKGFLRHVGPDKGGHWEVVDKEETEQSCPLAKK